MGSQGPPSLSMFCLEAELWKRLGLHLSDLESRPWREVEDYFTYLELITREEQAQARRSSHGARR
jgi:hypothetical protein